MLPLRIAVIALATTALPAQAQRAWLEVSGPHVTVVSDAGEAQARHVAWQFEQVREALARMFPWVRVDGPVPLLVIGARNEASMRALAPEFWERGTASSLVSVSQRGRDRNFVLVRADVRGDDREGVNPWQSAYWAYTATALRETDTALPAWLVRGLSSVLSNTLVRDAEVQVGRVLPQHLQQLRTRSRRPLKDLVGEAFGRDPSLDELEALDAQAWAFVHFLAFGEKGAHAKLLDAYVNAVLSGADPATSLASTVGDVSRFETPFAGYLERGIYGYARVEIAARITREGFAVREVPAGESAAVRAAFRVAMQRPADARVLLAEADKAGPEGIGDEVRALLAEAEGAGEIAPLFERAVARPTATWYAPFRLATLLPTTGTEALERIEPLLAQATARNPQADGAWAFLAEVQAALGRGEVALEAVQRAIRLRPASSPYRVSLARVLQRLDRLPEALKAAGSARALARSTSERDEAQEMLIELATRANAPDTSADATAALESACRAGTGDACAQLAVELLKRNGPSDRDRARELLRAGCEAGDQPSCDRLKQLTPG